MRLLLVIKKSKKLLVNDFIIEGFCGSVSVNTKQYQTR